ncbi:MAG: hypothetical protein ACRES7_08730 [Gammaproteobacteria bacterium]
MKKWFAFGTAALLFAALPYIALAKDGVTAVQQEIATAGVHATLAASADSLTMTHTHLHHVVNCLVGPKGAGFDTSAENPCKGMGKGAIPDAGSNSKLLGILKNALATANAGLKSNKEGMAQQAAKKTAILLKMAQSPKQTNP